MSSVEALLQNKGDSVWSVAPTDSVYDALQLMADKNIGAVLVLEDGNPVGIFSERDYARSIVLHGKVSRTTGVAEVMSRRLFYVRPDQTIEECMALMSEKHLRHLPVIENERLAGVISIGDVVNAVIAKQNLKLKCLHNQITGYDQFQRF